MFSRVIKRSRSMRVGPGHAAGGGGGRGGALDTPDDAVIAHVPSNSTAAEPAFVSDRPALPDASWQALHNAELSPVQFPGGRNPYLDRPLPPPPPPKNSTTGLASVTLAMPARPSTSGGPNAKASAFLGLTMRPAADKRMSKDDLYLNGYTGSRKAIQPYWKGARGGLPTPESSPEMYQYPVASPPFMAPARLETPESLSSGEIQIGMALGSPSHPPPATYASWQPQSIENRRPLTPPELYQPPVRRPKTQKRKLFGNLFGSRKNAEATKPDPEFNESNSMLSSTVMTTAVGAAGWVSGENTPVRSNTVADRKMPKYKPIVIRSNTAPAMDSPMVESSGSRPGRAQGEYMQNDFLSPDPVPELSAPSTSTATSTSSPFLDIEIPSIKMERYSVMFGSVLNTGGTSNSSSLLARRQATLEKLKTINDRILQEEEEKERLQLQLQQRRRATSPQPTKSPAFTLFPPTPNRQGPGASPLGPTRKMGESRIRSNTSPALLPSPSRPSFDLSQHEQHPRKEKKTVTIISPRTMELRHNPSSGPPSSRTPSYSPDQHQQPHNIPASEAQTFQFGPGVSGLILDSPQSTIVSSPPPIADPAPPLLRPTIAEPEWQMMEAPVSSSASSTTTITTNTTARRSPSSSASSISTHVTRPSMDIDDSDTALKAAVEISIARQISISRQQRTLLLRPGGRGEETNIPLPVQQTGRGRAVTVSRPGEMAIGPMKKMSLSRKEGRVVETKFGTPLVVAPGQEGHMGGGGGGAGGGYRDAAANRKSEWVVVEAM